VRTRSSQYPERRSPLLPLAIIVLVAIGVGFLAGVLISGDRDGTATSGTPTPRPSGSAAPSLAPAGSGSAPVSPTPVPAGPSPVVAAPDGILPPGAAARVTVDILRVREAPATDAKLLDQVPAGQLLLIHQGAVPDGPIEGGGFAWYPVQRIGELTELPALPGALPDDGVLGWAAAGDAETAYLELVEPRCPARPASLATLEAMLPWERLACFGSEPIQLEGVIGCPGCGGATEGTFEPAWLASPLSGQPISVDPAVRIGRFTVIFPPDGPALPAAGSVVRMTGHFDDPAAAGCVIGPGEPAEPIDSRTAALFCRERMVVDAIEVTGTDPDFPTG
jgi:hypothetical protein